MSDYIKEHDKMQTQYETHLKEKEQTFESLCLMCGKCCGSEDGDPCAKLAKNNEGKYYCTTYSDRLGPQKTVKGHFFTCVSIREHIRDASLRQGCGYQKAGQNQ